MYLFSWNIQGSYSKRLDFSLRSLRQIRFRNPIHYFIYCVCYQYLVVSQWILCDTVPTRAEINQTKHHFNSHLNLSFILNIRYHIQMLETVLWRWINVYILFYFSLFHKEINVSVLNKAAHFFWNKNKQFFNMKMLSLSSCRTYRQYICYVQPGSFTQFVENWSCEKYLVSINYTQLALVYNIEMEQQTYSLNSWFANSLSAANSLHSKLSNIASVNFLSFISQFVIILLLKVYNCSCLITCRQQICATNIQNAFAFGKTYMYLFCYWML